MERNETECSEMEWTEMKTNVNSSSWKWKAEHACISTGHNKWTARLGIWLRYKNKIAHNEGETRVKIWVGDEERGRCGGREGGRGEGIKETQQLEVES